MKNFLNRVGLLIICIIEIAVGVIIVFNPEKIARTAILVAGIGLLVYGAISVISSYALSRLSPRRGLSCSRVSRLLRRACISCLTPGAHTK